MNRSMARTHRLLVVLSIVSFGCSERAPQVAGSPATATGGASGTMPAASSGDHGAGSGGMSGSSGSGGSSVAGSGGSQPASAGRTSTAGDGGKGEAGSGSSDAGEQIDRDAAPIENAGTGGAPAEPDVPRPRRDVPPPEQKFVAPETADVEALEMLANRNAIPVFTTKKFAEQSSRDRGTPNTDEENLVPLLAHDNRDMNNFICKSDNAEVAGGARIIAYDFDEPRCAESYVRGVVLTRFEGSGSLQRFWMTISSLLLANGMLDREILRIYVDDDPAAIIQAPLIDILNGSAGEMFAPPFGAGSRACVAWYYPVVFEKKLVIALDRLSSDYWFQADVAFDPAPRKRSAPAQRLPQRDRAIAELADVAANATPAAARQTERVTLKASESKTLQLNGPATIQALRLRIARSALRSLDKVRLAVRWDTAAEAAMDLPLLDLFAAGQQPVERSNRTLGAAADGDDQLLVLRLPMPFRMGSEWKLQNDGSESADFQLEWFGDDGVPSGSFGKLHVQRSEAGKSPMQLEHTVAEASRRGRYVGLCADVAGRPDAALGLGATPLNFLEGDLRASADGRRVLDGTGTEDYPDNAFYFMDTPKATPFAQNWHRVDDATAQPPGQVSFCRWHILGGEVDFQSSFKATLEVSQHDPSISDLHRTIAYLYLE